MYLIIYFILGYTCNHTVEYRNLLSLAASLSDRLVNTLIKYWNLTMSNLIPFILELFLF